MGFAVDTKDAVGLTDSELEELANLTADRHVGFDIGFLSKQRDEWVTATRVFEGTKLRGYSFYSLDRIGGTPAIVLGIGAVDANGKGERAVDMVLADCYRRASLAFPDEDVLVTSRLFSPASYTVLQGLSEVVPRPGYKPNGEERAWARRLAKRFGAEGLVDDRTFHLKGDDSSPVGGIDFGTAKAGVAVDGNVKGLFSGLNPAEGDRMIMCGWAMSEDLSAGRTPRRAGR